MKAGQIILYAVMALSLGACLSDDGKNTQLNEEVKLIDEYLAANGITENVLYDNFNGIRIHVHEYGKLAPPHDGQNVTVQFIGKLFPDSTTFTQGQVTDKLQSLSPFGFGVTVRNIMTGSIVTAYDPSKSGYGASGANGLPPDAILVYNIYLAHTERSPTAKAQFNTDSTARLQYIEPYKLDRGSQSCDVGIGSHGSGVEAFPNPYSVGRLDYSMSLFSKPASEVYQATLNRRSVIELID